MSVEISELERRLAALEEIMVAAAGGDYRSVEVEHDDALGAIELGIDSLIGALRLRVDELDERVNERTSELQATIEELTKKNELIKQQRMAIAELSTPVLQLWDHVIAMPIIGIVDTERSMEMTEKLLAAVASGDVRYTILDITGVEVVDTATAARLLEMVRATRLLGSTCILTGVQPIVAQTLVSIGVDLGDTQIHRNLQGGLRASLLAMSRTEGDEA